MKHQQLQMSTIKTFVVFSVLVSAIYLHTVKWGSYSLDIIPLKINEFIGRSTLENSKNIANICAERKQTTCVIKSYEKLVKVNPKDPEAYALLAITLEKAKRSQEAKTYYSQYFLLGGNNIDLAYNFARLLEKSNDFENAKKYYAFVINSNPDIFQISASKAYAKLLIQSGQYKEAKKFIKAIRKKGQNAPFFMDEEYKAIASHKSL